jgi:hypothetical protein
VHLVLPSLTEDYIVKTRKGTGHKVRDILPIRGRYDCFRIVVPVLQPCQQRSIRRSIREIEPSDAEEVDPRTIAQISPDPGKCPVEVTSSIDHEAGIVPVLDDLDEIMDRQPPVTLPADDCDWPKSGCRL